MYVQWWVQLRGLDCIHRAAEAWAELVQSPGSGRMRGGEGSREGLRRLLSVKMSICGVKADDIFRAPQWLFGPLVSSVAKSVRFICKAGHFEL